MEIFNKKIKEIGDLIEKYHKLIFWLIEKYIGILYFY